MSNGFSDLEKHLNKISKTAKELDGDNEIPFNELFTSNFISKHTDYSTIEDFTSASGLDFSSQEAIEDINESVLDNFVASNSTFDSWEDMLASAIEEWVAKKMGF
ncbi:hypothetical protein [Carnobacterium divergens]|uniref:Uncharacterized protein n=1 Tax=Carnobacterium divergens TaxID=2748 RepID=A0A7Z8CWC9_CARDV|nr:hypothetical protein CKN58_11730 [Carnobacterium divergens]TFI75088.1 hypothetical protein CKN85_11785 [Carnobacterium divergens]TFI80912.1 hypothetical protein CKN56_11815 [Carnobacterium divergens]TFI93319.1 hypothetical protein CKN64_11750 [Carnobacterium divergens]TFJ09351.1 hypothetical protein CKN60_11780 [Carnobacterium divergens]